MRTKYKTVLFLAPFLFSSLLCYSCSTPRTDPGILIRQWMDKMRVYYHIQPGDRLYVTLESLPELAQEVRVDPKGNVTLMQIGVVKCKGKTLNELQKEVQAKYRKLYTDVRVSVILRESAEQVVYVGGEVRGGGAAIPYRPGMTLLRAIIAVGSFDITAKTSEVFLYRQDGKGKTHQYRIDLNKIAYEGGMDIPLLPNDAIFLQTSGVADVGNWVELYIRRMLPIQPGTVVGSYVGASVND